MALFKILKGQSTNLANVKATDGWAYFTPDDGKFYIDVAGDGSQAAVIGTSRIPLNAKQADAALTVPQAITSKGTTSSTDAGTSYGVAGVTSGSRIYSKWYVNLDNKVKTLTDGMLILIRVPVAGSSSGTAITIDGTNFHPVVFNTSEKVTTHYGVGTILLLTYDSTGTCSVYGNATGVASKSTASLTGVWRVMNNYQTDTNTLVRVYKDETN